MGLIKAWRRRDIQFAITIVEADGDNYVWVATDVIRVKVGRKGAAPLLDLSSKAASDNGSTVSQSNPVTMQLAAADITLLPRGFYEFEISIVDDSDQDRIKHVETHVLHVIETMSGAVSI